jgi:transcriptional regulator with PAS, ATPase and Fis domain
LAAIPSELIESELFGSEKDAYTGSVERKIGKFEEANGGTIWVSFK